MADEKVTFQLTAQDKATATIKRLKGELNAMGGTAAKASGPMGKLSAVTGGLVSPVTLGISAAAGLSAALLNTVQGASDLNEEIDKSRVVFGPASAEMEAFAEGAAEIGLSERAALGAAGAFGNMFKTVGLAQGASQDMSEQMVRLAADMASFNNEDPSEMLDKLRSGLSGEAEPLRRFGVLLSEAAVQAFAFRTGIAETGSKLTEAQKVQARYGLILEQTALQQGNFEDTSNSLANMQRQLAAEFQNISDEIGTALLPVLRDFAIVARDDVVPTLRDLVELGGQVGGFVGEVEGFLNTVSAAVTEAGLAVNGFITGDDILRVRRFAEETGESFNDIKDRVEQRMKETGESFDEAAGRIERRWHASNADISTSTGVMMQDIISQIEVGAVPIEREWGRIAAVPASMMAAENRAIRDAAFQHQVEYAKGLLDGQNEPLVQMEALAQLQAETLDAAAEIARLKGQLNSAELAAGLADNHPAIRAQAEAARMAIVNQLANLGIDASTWGYGIAASMAAGLNNGYGVVVDAAGNLAAAVRGQIGIESEPRDPSSPLRGITKWGGNLVRTYAEGMIGALDMARGAAGRVAGAVVPMPVLPSYGGATAYAGAAMGGRTLTIIVNPSAVWSPGDGQRLARAITPEIQREWKRQGLVSG